MHSVFVCVFLIRYIFADASSHVCKHIHILFERKNDLLLYCCCNDLLIFADGNQENNTFIMIVHR